ncbi:MAG: MFS transporter [Halioglobus sp.]|jgi:DHA1 family tetracycline resistance protein-like MFS transporter
MLIVFLVIVLDLIGFGIMVPILAYYVVQLGGGPELATFSMALYAIGMFVATPILGRLSDFYGRKPILMLSMVGAIIGYLMLGFAQSLWVVALARLLAGFMAGNISAAQAYITDITSEENRARGMGLIGAAFGLGFVIGPALGSYLAGDDFATANLRLPAMVSAGMAGAALLAIILLLPESLDPAHKAAARARPPIGRLAALGALWDRPLIPHFLVGVLIYNTGAGLSEAIYPLWVRDTGIAAGPRDLMPLLLVSGIVLSLVQGGLIGPLTRAFGEHRLFQLGAVGFALAMVATVVAGEQGSYYGAMAALAFQSASAALVLTSMQSLVSQCAGPAERGMLLGIYSSAGTLGRIIGTVLTGVIFARIHIESPYALTALVMLCLLLIARSVEGHWNAQRDTVVT